MLFSEIYSTYYQTVGVLLKLAAKGELTRERMQREITERAYAESFMTIIPALTSEQWQLMNAELKTPVIHEAERPYTELELRFLKTISMDKRMALFETEMRLSELDALKNVEPLFLPEDVVLFDQYLDGDPYTDAHYQEMFHKLLRAIHERAAVQIDYEGRRGVRTFNCFPYQLEYSEKDDKFRVLVKWSRGTVTMNVARILRAAPRTEQREMFKIPHPQSSHAESRCVLELVDERNALERVLLHFAHFEKTAQRLEGRRYRVTLLYDQNDETELVIRVLSFGPMVRVVEPESFVNLIRTRLYMQRGLGLQSENTEHVFPEGDYSE